MQTMEATQLSPDMDTLWNLLKGLSSRKSYDEYLSFFQKYKLEIVDEYFLDILLRLGIFGNQKWLLPVCILHKNLIFLLIQNYFS